MTDINKEDLQNLLEEYHTLRVKLSDITNKLSQCIKTHYYPTVEDYIKNEKEFKDEITTMLARVDQIILEKSEEHKGKHHKSPDEIAQTKAREQIKRKVDDIYNSIGRKVFGFDSDKEFNAHKKLIKGGGTPSPAIVSRPETPSEINAIPFDFSSAEKALQDLNEDGEVGLPSPPPSSLGKNTFDSSIYQAEEQDDDSGVLSPAQIYQQLSDDCKKLSKPNPYQHKHQISLPTFGLVLAPSGSGKTALMYQYFQLFQDGDKGKTFDAAYIITKDSDEPIYNDIRKKRPEFQILEGIENLPDLNMLDKSKNTLIVLDDMVNEKNTEMIKEYALRGRKADVTLFFLSQSYFKTDIFIRENAMIVAVLGLTTKGDTTRFLADVSCGLDSNTMMKIYKHATRNIGVPLMINLRVFDVNKRFWRGFSPVKYNPADFEEKSKGPATSQATHYVSSVQKSGAQPQDIFYTPDEVVDIILEDCVEILGDNMLKGLILDPCKGEGAYLKKFPAFFPGHTFDWCEIEEGKDFLTYESPVFAIIGNPPYSLINKFIEKATALRPRIISFLLLTMHISTRRFQLINQSGYAVRGLRFLNIRDWFNPVNVILERIDDRPVEMTDNCIRFTPTIFKQVKVNVDHMMGRKIHADDSIVDDIDGDDSIVDDIDGNDSIVDDIDGNDSIVDDIDGDDSIVDEFDERVQVEVQQEGELSLNEN